MLGSSAVSRRAAKAVRGWLVAGAVLPGAQWRRRVPGNGPVLRTAGLNHHPRGSSSEEERSEVGWGSGCSEKCECVVVKAQVQNVLEEGFGGLALKPGLVLSRNLLPPGETNREDQPGSQSPPTFNVKQTPSPPKIIYKQQLSFQSLFDSNCEMEKLL